MRQLVDAAIKFQDVNVFHRDLKLENILIETDDYVPRVRVIDFGCGCLDTGTLFHSYTGTSSCLFRWSCEGSAHVLLSVSL